VTNLGKPLARLLLKISGPPTAPTGALACALDAMTGARRQDGWIELADEDTGEPLRLLNRACGLGQDTAIVLAQVPVATPPDAPYARLWDRTDEFATQLASWKEGVATLPALLPGELIRLPV
jgi:hypothetical protein